MNIKSINNTLCYYSDDDIITTLTVPIGAYEFQDLSNYLNKVFHSIGISFNLSVNKNTLKSTIKSSKKILFSHDGLHTVLGFKPQTLEANKLHESESVINITEINLIRIECNIVTNYFVNGVRSHILHEFPLQADSGHKIIEIPRNTIYLPIVTKQLNTIQLLIKDQNNNLIDFNGEIITCRIHIKRIVD